MLNTHFNAADLDASVRALTYCEHIHATHIGGCITEAYADGLERAVIMAAYNREITNLYRAVMALQDIQSKILNDAMCMDPEVTDAVNDLLGPIGL